MKLPRWPRGWATPLDVAGDLLLIFVVVPAMAVVAAFALLVVYPLGALWVMLDNLTDGLHPLYGLVRGHWVGGRWRPGRREGA